MLLEISGEITPERMKGWSQSKNMSITNSDQDANEGVSTLSPSILESPTLSYSQEGGGHQGPPLVPGT